MAADFGRERFGAGAVALSPDRNVPVAARLRQGPSAPSAWQVEVPGGLLTVTARPDGIDLRGPAVLTGEIPASELQFLAM